MGERDIFFRVFCWFSRGCFIQHQTTTDSVEALKNSCQLVGFSIFLLVFSASFKASPRINKPTDFVGTSAKSRRRSWSLRSSDVTFHYRWVYPPRTWRRQQYVRSWTQGLIRAPLLSLGATQLREKEQRAAYRAPYFTVYLYFWILHTMSPGKFNDTMQNMVRTSAEFWKFSQVIV